MSSFDSVSQSWLVRFLEHRIGDPRIIRLIQKWLKAGVLEDGVVTTSEMGTGQGSVISPLLANVYLHYVFDLWAERWRRHEAKGDIIIIRYADDIVVGFEHEADARRFWDAMRERFETFALSLHPDKTRLIEFGRYAAERRARRGFGKPETFNGKTGRAFADMSPGGLDGIKIAVARASAHEAYLRANFTLSAVQVFDSPELARDAVILGSADLLFDDGVGLAFWLLGTASKACCEFKGGPFFEPRYFGDGVGITVNRGDPELKAQLNAALKRLRETGRQEELLSRSFPLRGN